MEKLVVPCAFSGISLCCCLPLRELGLYTKFEKYRVNLRGSTRKCVGTASCGLGP